MKKYLLPFLLMPLLSYSQTEVADVTISNTIKYKTLPPLANLGNTNLTAKKHVQDLIAAIIFKDFIDTLYLDNPGIGDTLMRKSSDNSIQFKSIRVVGGAGIKIIPTISDSTIMYIVESVGRSGGLAQVITSGTTANINDATAFVYIDPPARLAALRIKLPANPADEDEITIAFGGTLKAGTIVSLFSITPNVGQFMVGSTIPTAPSTSTPVILKYRSQNKVWYRTK